MVREIFFKKIHLRFFLSIKPEMIILFYFEQETELEDLTHLAETAFFSFIFTFVGQATGWYPSES